MHVPQRMPHDQASCAGLLPGAAASCCCGSAHFSFACRKSATYASANRRTSACAAQRSLNCCFQLAHHNPAKTAAEFADNDRHHRCHSSQSGCVHDLAIALSGGLETDVHWRPLRDDGHAASMLRTAAGPLAETKPTSMRGPMVADSAVS